MSGLPLAGLLQALLLGLDHAGGFAIDIEQVVGEAMAGGKRKLAKRHTPRGMEVGLGEIEDAPAGCGEQAVDFEAGELFRRDHAVDAIGLPHDDTGLPATKLQWW